VLEFHVDDTTGDKEDVLVDLSFHVPPSNKDWAPGEGAAGDENAAKVGGRVLGGGGGGMGGWGTAGKGEWQQGERESRMKGVAQVGCLYIPSTQRDQPPTHQTHILTHTLCRSPAPLAPTHPPTPPSGAGGGAAAAHGCGGGGQ
jgi:hypothetical protein